MAVVKKKVVKKKAQVKKKPAKKANKGQQALRGVRPLRPVAKIKKKPAVKTAKKGQRALQKVSAKKVAKPIKKPAKRVRPLRVAKERGSVGARRSPVKVKKPVVVVAVQPQTPVPIVSKKSEPKIGEVMHYYAQIGVAVVRLDQNALRVGEQIHIKGHTTDFTQIVESMEVDHQPVVQAIVGDLFGLKVAQHVREGDVVYKV